MRLYTEQKQEAGRESKESSDDFKNLIVNHV